MLSCLICVHDLLSSSCHVVSLLSFLVFIFFFFLFFIIIIIIVIIFYWLHVCAKEIIYSVTRYVRVITLKKARVLHIFQVIDTVDMKLIHRPLMGELLRLVQRGGDWAGPQPAQAPPRCAKCNSALINGQCTNHRIAV